VPEGAVDQVVPLRDQVVDRAPDAMPLMSLPVWQKGCRNPAARALGAQLFSSMCSWNSFQSPTRAVGERSTAVRGYSMSR